MAKASTSIPSIGPMGMVGKAVAVIERVPSGEIDRRVLGVSEAPAQLKSDRVYGRTGPGR